MTIQDLGSVGELIAAVATVATLVYLAMQIRQNTQALHRAAVHSTVESGHSVRSEFIQNPEVATLYLKGLSDPRSLSQEEALRFGMLMLRDVEQPSRVAASLLIAVGVECVPNLVDHINDDTLTRAVGYGGRRWQPSPYPNRIIRVGELCKQILDRLIPETRLFNYANDRDSHAAMKNHYTHKMNMILRRRRTTP